MVQWAQEVPAMVLAGLGQQLGAEHWLLLIKIDSRHWSLLTWCMYEVFTYIVLVYYETVAVGVRYVQTQFNSIQI